MRNTTKLFFRSLFTLVFLLSFLSMAWAADPPIAVADTVYTQEGIPVRIDVLANDSIPDGYLDLGSLKVVASPADGTAVADTITGLITYTPSPGFVGVDTFSYEICDNSANPQCDIAVVTVIIVSGCYGVIVPFEGNREEERNSVDTFSTNSRYITVLDAPNYGHVLKKTNILPGFLYHPGDLFNYHFTDTSAITFIPDTLRYISCNKPRTKCDTFTVMTKLCRYKCPGSRNDCDTTDYVYYFHDNEPLRLFISPNCRAHAHPPLNNTEGPSKGTLNRDSAHYTVYTPHADSTGNDLFSFMLQGNRKTVKLIRLASSLGNNSLRNGSRPLFPFILLIGGLLVAVLLFILHKKGKK